MSFKDFFIKPDEPKEEKPQAQQNEPNPFESAQATEAQPQTFSDQTVTTTSIDAEADESGIRHLWEVLTERNIPGPDLLEVKNFAESLKGTGDPLEKRYLQAFLILKSQNPAFCKSSLLQSIETYKSYVLEEKQEGLRQFAEKKREKITDKDSAITNLKSEIESIADQIKKLQEQSFEKEKEIETLKAEIEASTAEINVQEAKFNATFTQFLEALENDKRIMSNLNIQ